MVATFSRTAGQEFTLLWPFYHAICIYIASMLQSVAFLGIWGNILRMNGKEDSLFQLDGAFPGLRFALPIALQHLVVMIVGCVTPAIIISDLAGLSAADSTLMVQTSLVAAGLSTLIQLFLGSRLPMIMGISFSYLASMQAIVSGYGLAEIFGAQIVGGAVALVIGIFVKRIRRLFPPLITGTVVFTIGLSLYPTAITYMAGGQGNPDFGSWQNWAVAIITFVAVVILSNYTKGFIRLSAIQTRWR